MPLTAFLRIPDVPGESGHPGHEGEIDIEGLSWGIARGATRGMTVLKRYDVASPYLTLAAAQGRGFPEVVLTIRRDSGDAGSDFLTVTMERVVVATYDIEDDDAPDGDGLREKVSLSFDRVRVFYRDGRDEHEIGFEVMRHR